MINTSVRKHSGNTMRYSLQAKIYHYQTLCNQISGQFR